jgi:hypothetical protein
VCASARTRPRNVVADSAIEWCALYRKGEGVDEYAYHNGEGVYIGTSPKSEMQPMHADDESLYNVARDNTISTFGSECVDVKENAHDNVFRGQCLPGQ